MAFTSVLVLNWNGRKWLKKCLSSILAQKADNVNFEVILVDNNSDDGSVEYVKKYFPEVRVVQLNANYGFAEGNNQGVKYANGEYLVFVNQDTEAQDLWLENLIEAADSNPDFQILASLQLPESKDAFVRTINALGDVPVGLRCTKKVTESLFASGGCFLIRKKWLTKIGYLFDSYYFCYAEDLELSLRTIFQGGKIGYVKNSKIYHFGWSSDLNRDRIHYYNTRNILFTYYKLFKPQNFIRICSANIVSNIINCLFRKQPLNVYAILKATVEFFIKASRYSEFRKNFARKKLREDYFVFKRMHFSSELEKKLFSAFYGIG